MSEELGLYTTDQLIMELLHRTTFQGVIVRSHDDYRGREWQGPRNFRVHWNANLSDSEVTGVIEAVAEAFYNRNDFEEQGE